MLNSTDSLVTRKTFPETYRWILGDLRITKIFEETHPFDLYRSRPQIVLAIDEKPDRATIAFENRQLAAVAATDRQR